jgi:hypothetical protein
VIDVFLVVMPIPMWVPVRLAKADHLTDILYQQKSVSMLNYKIVDILVDQDMHNNLINITFSQGGCGWTSFPVQPPFSGSHPCFPDPPYFMATSKLHRNLAHLYTTKTH